MTRYFLGIDGGGSSLRLLLTDTTLHEVARSDAGTANPSVIGRNAAAQHLQEQIRALLHRSQLSPADIAAVGLGIAGAAAGHSAQWLRETVGAVLPQTLLAPASDLEIALVGAHGQRAGILLLAGTGSAALGINAAGERYQAGGWGYLIGDGGSGAWIGMAALRALCAAADGLVSTGPLTAALMQALALNSPRDLLQFLYNTAPPIAQIAALAPLVLEHAAAGDTLASEIVAAAVQELARLLEALRQQPALHNAPVKFAGSLLDQPTLLRQRLLEHLALPDDPQALYPPLMGAVLLAKLSLEKELFHDAD